MDDTLQKLDITNPKDRYLFIEHLKELCSVLQSDIHVTDPGLVTTFKDIHNKIRVSVIDVGEKTAAGEFVSDESMEALQVNYNQLLQVHEQLCDTAVDTKVAPEPLKQSSSKEHTAAKERGRQSKEMLVRPDENSVQSINIIVAAKSEAKLKNELLSFVPVMIRKQRLHNIPLPSNPVQSVIHHNKLPVTIPEKTLEANSLTQLYLRAARYQTFIKEHYSSAKAFERLLDSTIARIEKETTDVFERWLQEEQASAFLLLQPLSVAEVLEFSSDPRVRAKLKESNVKYETFLHWVDLIPDMQAVVESDDQIVFGKLYARWVIELKMASS